MWSREHVAQARSPTSTGWEPGSPSSRRIPGRRFAQIVKLKVEHVEKYKEAHAKVWPEVLQQIKLCNIRDCK